MFYDSASAPSSTKLSERASMGTNGHAPSVPYPLASECAAFIDRAPTPFHCCAEAARQLVEAGFTELAEDESWSGALKPGGKYFYRRNGSSLVGFAVGAEFAAGTGGISVVGAHTDSPVLKLKPCSKRSAHGYLQLSVECYGGGLWHTWFDRELGVAGAVIVKKGDGSFVKELVHVKRPILRVPTLCIHLQSADERAAFAPNKESHLQPILALESIVKEQLGADANGEGGADAAAGASPAAMDARHAPALLKLLASELGCAVGDIQDFELTLCDTQPSQLWGLHNEFLSAPRLDNQVHCFTALKALVEHANAEKLEGDQRGGEGDVAMIALFDHEEVGSDSTVGAGGPIMAEALRRVSLCFPPKKGPEEEALLLTTRKSFFISADTAHAVHPNWAAKHEASHTPKLNGGTVIKSNDNQRYATNAPTGFVVRELARRSKTSVQEFMVRNDCPCGMTIGPMVASKTGVRTVDVGVASLSMHSIRETVGADDVRSSFVLFTTFFRLFREIDGACKF